MGIGATAALFVGLAELQRCSLMPLDLAVARRGSRRAATRYSMWSCSLEALLDLLGRGGHLVGGAPVGDGDLG